MSAQKSSRIDLASLASAPPPTGAKTPAPPRSGTGTRAIEVHRIAANPLNTRKLSRAKVESLGVSMKDRGQYSSCTVVNVAAFLRLFPEHDDKVAGAEYVQVNGGRRLLAARKEKIATLDVTVKDAIASSRLDWLAATAQENVEREDLDPIEEAHALRLMAEECGDNQSVVAEKMNRTRQWVSQRIGLLRLVPQLQDQLSDGDLPIALARKLSAEDPDRQLALLAALRAEQGQVVGSGDGPVPPGPEAGPRPTPAAVRPTPQQTAIRRLGGTGPQIGENLLANLERQDLLDLWTLLGQRLGVK
ncbi:MAG: ParB N-terminal domain-containing protein [Mycobacterium sp.]